MEIHIVREPISRETLAEIAREGFGDLVKAVVDIEQEIMALGSELHVDAEMLLTEKAGSSHEHVWGINLYPGKSGEEFIEFDSMINLKPAFGNRSRSIEDPAIQESVKAVVEKLILA